MSTNAKAQEKAKKSAVRLPSIMPGHINILIPPPLQYNPRKRLVPCHCTPCTEECGPRGKAIPKWKQYLHSKKEKQPPRPKRPFMAAVELQGASTAGDGPSAPGLVTSGLEKDLKYSGQHRRALEAENTETADTKATHRVCHRLLWW
ncbi:hypothetical protein EVG20_g3116 [Dentipellis fragilis]|uniref:Uncharacterized protein n=1 Tax=Dentipellis fragilis TaxID=205917 RepID=A0A4Y9Z842_9AGAM|nr:hypothetical protein EVG20_g3116 [Dentipellis fragilis]